jgi:pimeloyl-ACP methyl ester carboxylesterase
VQSLSHWKEQRGRMLYPNRRDVLITLGPAAARAAIAEPPPHSQGMTASTTSQPDTEGDGMPRLQPKTAHGFSTRTGARRALRRSYFTTAGLCRRTTGTRRCFLANGYRVVAHDRRGHGRSSQVDAGHDMSHHASDASAVVEHLDLRNAIHVGHSTGGGEVARYVAKSGEPQGRVAKVVLIAAVPPLMVKTEKNPGGTPIEVFDGFRKALAENPAQFFLDVPSVPFYGFNRPGEEGFAGNHTELVASGDDGQRARS